MAAVITVSTLSGLYDALAHATGGETIQLASGNYGNLSLGTSTGHNGTFPTNVTITSADPLHPATFSGFALNGVSNLTLDGVVCDYTFKTGDPVYTAPFSINGGDHITIKNSTFDGDVAKGTATAADGFATGLGLTVTGTQNLVIQGNEISNFYRGLTVSETTNATIAGNDVHAIRSDGMDFIQVQGITIEANHIHDFLTSPDSGDHPDMIQFWTSGTTQPSTDIVIRGNLLDSGNGTWTQSIFMRNEMVDQGLAGQAMYYRNVTIEQNV
ncbi:MAG: right-handed parallel beta-helix repeat-containing protein, partial [Paracoccaceae bacterium]